MTTLKEADVHSALYAEGFNMTASVDNIKNSYYHGMLSYGDKDSILNATQTIDNVHNFTAGECRIEMVHFEAANTTETEGTPKMLSVDFEVLFKHSAGCNGVDMTIDLVKNGQYLSNVDADMNEAAAAYVSESLSIVTISAPVDSFVGDYYAQIDIREETTGIAYIYDSEVFAL